VNPHVLSTGQGTFGIQPQVAGGCVYLASQYGIGPGGGVLLAHRDRLGDRDRRVHPLWPL
jgi:hypothetical protein